MVIVFFIIATIVYCSEILVLYSGLIKSDKPPGVSGYQPKVTIVVAARNEENYLENCIKSLTLIDYPKEKLEIVIVDDRSNDRTPSIIQSFVKSYPFIKTIRTKPETGNLRGKANALTHGIDISDGEILMFTDADCTVHPGWVKETVRYFDAETGIIGGFVILDTSNKFENMQNLDWIFLIGVASAASGLNIPLTVVGNNLSLRRSVYNATGGYRTIPFSVTEDYRLVQAVLKTSPIKIKYPYNTSTAVKSKACSSWKQLFRQRQRWGVGGLSMVFAGKLIMAVGWAFNLLLILGIFLIPLWLSFIMLLIKLLFDFQFIWKLLRRFDININLLDFLLFEIYYIVYVLLIPFIAVFSKKIIWKERTL